MGQGSGQRAQAGIEQAHAGKKDGSKQTSCTTQMSHAPDAAALPPAHLGHQLQRTAQLLLGAALQAGWGAGGPGNGEC